MSVRHDIIVTEKVDGRERTRIVKSEIAAYPHARCCAGCRTMRVCHVCGTTLVKYGVGVGCTSGACSGCCHKEHTHQVN